MPNDSQPTLDNTGSNPPTSQPTKSGSQRVIQPSAGFVQEVQAQQALPQLAPATTTSPGPIQATQPLQSQPVYPPSGTPANGQMQVGMSASQMGWNQSSKTNSFDLKKLAIKGAVGLIVLGGVFAVLVFTNIITLSQFKTISYTNSSGTSYSLTFYSKHTTTTLQSGNTQLVSKVSEDGHYPLTLSIASGPTSELDKNGIKTCSGPLPKVFDVQNNNLNQQISVCSVPQTNGPVGVYIMGFAANNQANIVTISQDLSSENLSSQSAGRQSLTKFGLDPYQDDIKKIVASIKAQ